VAALRLARFLESVEKGRHACRRAKCRGESYRREFANRRMQEDEASLSLSLSARSSIRIREWEFVGRNTEPARWLATREGGDEAETTEERDRCRVLARLAWTSLRTAARREIWRISGERFPEVHGLIGRYG